jgi:hypothetical protein
MIFKWLIIFIGTFSTVIPCVIGLYYYRGAKNEMKIFIFLFTFTFLLSCLTYTLYRMGLKFFWAQHIYTPVEYVSWMIIFYRWIGNPHIKRLVILSIPIFLAICVWDMFDSAHIDTINSLTASVACVVYVAVSSYTLIAFQRKFYGADEKDYRQWFLAGLLIYSAGGLCYFSFFNMFNAWAIYTIFQLLNVASYILYSIGLICMERRRSLSGA